MPSASTSCCSCGSGNRGVSRVPWSRRQKSLRGFAKWAPAAAETLPGLIPQKTTRRSRARTSGRAESGCFGLGELFGITRLEQLLETPPNRLAGQQHLGAGPSRLEPDDPHRRLPAAVAPRVALGLGERAQPSHARTL